MSAANEFERKYVHEFYDWKALSTRRSSAKWRKVEEFLLNFEVGACIADIGCGHGQYIQNGSNFMVGLERSIKTCDMLTTSNQQIQLGDVANLPYRSNLFDGVICVAVIHHLATKRRRKSAIVEICRVLRKGGKAFITVWAMEQKHSKYGGKDVLVPIKTRKERNKEGRQNQQHKISPEKLDHLTNIERIYSYITKETYRIKTKVCCEVQNYLTEDSAPEPKAKNDVSLKHLGACDEVDIKTQSICGEENLGRDKANISLDKDFEDNFFKYYHVFTDSELLKLIAEVKNVKLIEHFFDNRNWVFIVEKL
ncbi:uncharacterized protein LOC130655364 [Hydractinia symbiolongicarpus]|uniref:uncharacterized protein LOC130655364 n=1 Tax=Hydractinia symbiolongicarpus TaxID=13093 RepID=UPI00254B8B5D|nr:uncharacterized protein LOC130655364 [Hydractinia symbiolongicarpus]XP_057314097.1 uncharacterized protein LOC130655364 [Hydractinia symbiolongicarpus]